MSPLINVPSSDSSPTEKQPIPPGEYSVRIIELKETKTQKGVPQLQWKLEIQSGHPSFHGRWLSYWTGFSSGGLNALVHLLQCAGLDAYTSGPFNSDDVIGKMINVTLESNFRDGVESQYPKVMAVNPFDPETVDDLPF